MQTGKAQIERQQLILYVKGFYHGKIDGVWSTKTVDAKKKWEATGRGFTPGLPNNGLPFGNRGPYPRGITIGKDGLLTCIEVEEYLALEKDSSPQTKSVLSKDEETDEE